MQLSQIDLNLLRALDALLSERSVTRAAEKLYVTQQAASGSLRRLREVFDDLLLVRAGREMELTPLARELVKPLREALLTLERTVNIRPTFDPMTTVRALRLAISDYGNIIIMPHILRALAREAPLIALEVNALTERSFSALDHGEIDFLITLGAAVFVPDWIGDELHQRLLFQDDFVCVADKAHPELKEGLTRDLYMRLPHCLVRFGTLGATLVQKAWKDQELDLRIASTAPGFANMMFMLPGTLSLGTVQRALAAALAGMLGLSIFECPIPVGRVEEHLFWHERCDHDPTHAFVISLFERVAAQMKREQASVV